MISRYLLNLLGENGISDREIDKFVYSTDASQLQGETSFVVWPTTRDQVHQLVLYARRSKKDLVVRGAGTNLVGGCVPSDSIVIDLSKMNKVLEASRTSLYVIVEPGVILGNLNKALKKANLMFPVIPDSSNVCTIGGMIASNAIGASRYGRVENWVSELEVIDGSGKLMVAKGSKIKDFCGTEGILGIITKAKLKLIEIPKVSANLYDYEDEYDLVERVKRLKGNENIIRVEFISGAAIRIANFESAKNYLFVEYEGEEGNLTGENEINEMWELRNNIYSHLYLKGYNIIEEVKVPVERLHLFFSWLLKNNLPSFGGGVSNGIVRVVFDDRKKVKEMYDYLGKIGGSIVAEFGIGLRKKEFVDKITLDKLKRLKKQYDPDEILNKNKIIMVTESFK